MANCVYGKRWFHTKRSAIADWRCICFGISSTLHMAHSAAHATLYKTNTPETNYTNIMDGSYLCSQCSKLFLCVI